jgi:hypothetical protein
MSTHQYLRFDHLKAELQAENDRRQKASKAATVRISDLVARGSLTFDSFCVARQPAALVAPEPPNVRNLEIGSRVTLMSPKDSKSSGRYDYHVMVVLGVKADNVLGYIFSTSCAGTANRCEVVSTDQIIQSQSPLNPGQSEDWVDFDDRIPF